MERAVAEAISDAAEGLVGVERAEPEEETEPEALKDWWAWRAETEAAHRAEEEEEEEEEEEAARYVEAEHREDEVSDDASSVNEQQWLMGMDGDRDLAVDAVDEEGEEGEEEQKEEMSAAHEAVNEASEVGATAQGPADQAAACGGTDVEAASDGGDSSSSRFSQSPSPMEHRPRPRPSDWSTAGPTAQSSAKPVIYGDEVSCGGSSVNEQQWSMGMDGARDSAVDAVDEKGKDGLKDQEEEDMSVAQEAVNETSEVGAAARGPADVHDNKDELALWLHSLDGGQGRLLQYLTCSLHIVCLS